MIAKRFFVSAPLSDSVAGAGLDAVLAAGFGVGRHRWAGAATAKPAMQPSECDFEIFHISSGQTLPRRQQ